MLYAILFLWQFPHFYAIAWMYREDYARAGIRMLPVVEPDGASTARRMVWFSLLLIPVSLLPQIPGHGRRPLSGRSDRPGRDVRYSAMRVWFERTRRARGRCCWRAWYICRFFMDCWCSIALISSLAAALVPGCGGHAGGNQGLGSVPDFTLTDQTGAHF